MINLRRSQRDGVAAGPWHVTKLVVVHNHLLATDARSISAGPLSEEQKREIYELAEMGVPASILRDVWQRLSVHTITENQFYSAISQAKRQYEDGRSDAEVLLAQLRRPGTFYQVCAFCLALVTPTLPSSCTGASGEFVRCLPIVSCSRTIQILTAQLPDGSRELRAVFWCHDFQVTAFQRNPTVICMDNTGMSLSVPCICDALVAGMECVTPLVSIEVLPTTTSTALCSQDE